MPSHHSKHLAIERSDISIDPPHELRYWTETLGLTRDELRAAVESVGPNVERVRKWAAEARKRRAAG